MEVHGKLGMLLDFGVHAQVEHIQKLYVVSDCWFHYRCFYTTDLFHTETGINSGSKNQLLLENHGYWSLELTPNVLVSKLSCNLFSFPLLLGRWCTAFLMALTLYTCALGLLGLLVLRQDGITTKMH